MSKTTNRRWPAEWEQHEATVLCWPRNPRDWPGKFPPIHWVFAEMVRLITRHEPVLLVVESPAQRGAVKDMLSRALVDFSRVTFVVQATDRNWLRDSGPVVVKTASGGREAVHFRFNAWAKYRNWKKDQHIPAALAKKIGIPRVEARLGDRHVVLEGGSIDGNGRGTMVTTEECLMHESVQVRNPGFTKDDYAAVFREYLGVTNIIWLGDGIDGDDTHGHVDDCCRFVGPTTLVTCREKNSSDENYRRLEENAERLQGARLEDGSRPTVVDLPMPAPVHFEDLRLPASYANFIFTAGSLLVPTFNDPMDRVALGILAELVPDRQVVGVHAVDLVWGLGTLHCLSRELPA